jgi:hypothetical protein
VEISTLTDAKKEENAMEAVGIKVRGGSSSR